MRLSLIKPHLTGVGSFTVGQDTTEAIQKIITVGIIEKNLFFD